MKEHLSFFSLILGEIILALIIALFFSIRHNLKQKSIIKRLFEKYSETKEKKIKAESKVASFYGKKNTEEQSTIGQYFSQSIADSLHNYEKNTGSHHPHLDSTHSFSARVAALRFLYLTAEKEVFDEHGITHMGWRLFEKKLDAIIRWQDKKNTQRQEVRDNRLRLMQDRVDKLKGSHRENEQLQEEINELLQSEKNLKQYHLESQHTINNLQEMLEKLNHLSLPDKSSFERDPQILHQEHTIKPQTTESSYEKNSAVVDMIKELKTYKSKFSAEIKENMNNYMNILEVELMKSDQHIGNLKKELKEAKMQATNYALMLRDTHNDENGLAVAADHTDKSLPSIAAPIEQKNIIVEIKQLRENNLAQRDLIAYMENEMQLLKQSINPTDSSDIRQEKEKEISRLERLVKEFQGCIDTLESEVDDLYNQLQERQDDNTAQDIKPESEYTNEELTMLTTELGKTISHYQQLHAINRLILELIRCESLQSIANEIIQFIKDFNAPIGFSIFSKLGNTEYFPEVIFDDLTKDLVKSPANAESLIHIDQGTLFILSKIHLMLINTPNGGHAILETSLHGLVNAVDECIKIIEARKANRTQMQETDKWITSTKNYLSNIDIQYASQAEENRKTFNNFISEIRRAYPLLDLHGPGAIVLDNAINEYEERMHLLLNSGDVIDNEISNLIEHMNKLKTNILSGI